MTPMQLHRSIAKEPAKIHHLKKILLGGSGVSQELLNDIRKLDMPIWLGYGMTESLTHVAVKSLNGIDPKDFYVAVDDSIRFSVSADSCLVINAEHIPDILQTNDLVELIDDKRFVWLGRKDNIINSGGLKINPESMEQKIKEVYSGDLMVSSVEDELLGERIVLIMDKMIDKNETAAFKERLKGLALKAMPRTLFFVDSFMYTSTGKLDRIATRHLIKSNKGFKL
jgi:O-succinylbenzoic acid--CoA ligase